MKKMIWVAMSAMIFFAAAGAQADQSYNEAMEKDLFEAGVKQFRQGEYQEAIDTFTDLINLFPQNADAFKNRGVAYMKLEKFDDAIADFQSAKNISPNLKGIYSNLGVIWYYNKNYEKAIENYNKEIEITPDNAVAYFNRALCMSKLDEIENAISDLTTAISISPDFYWAICYKADLLAHTGLVKEAITLYEMAIEKDHKTPYAIEKLATLQESAENVVGKGSVAASFQSSGSPADSDPSVAEDQIKTKRSGQTETVEESKVAGQQKTGKHAGDEVPGPVSDEPFYTLQSGAFLVQNNARNLKEKLLKNGFEANILILRDKKLRPWYLVRSGRYTTRDQARKDTAAIQELTGIAPVIRPEGIW